MRPLRPSLHLRCPRQALLLYVVLLAGLAGCGPASSDNAPNLGPRVSVAGPTPAQKSPAPRNDPAPPSASPVPLAADNETGPASVRRIDSGGDNANQGGRQLLKSAGASNGITDGRDQSPIPSIPDSIIKGLDSPDARVRLLTLDHLKEPKTMASLDLLFAALEDEDEAVRAKATEIIERHWTAEQGHK